MSTRGFLLFLLLCIADCDAMHKRDLAIANFLHERAAWQPMCLYTFDGPAINNRPGVMNRVPDDACPFDALQPDDELVTSLNTASSFWQLGVHLEEAPSNDTRRVQLSSTSSVSARDFFTMAAVRNNTAGVTFEMVIRRRAEANRSMTLFSIANEYDNCVDPGFRLDVNEHQVLAFIYFLPVLEEGGEAGVEACYEQRLFSVDNSAACQLPPLLDPVERTPPVQITVTLDPSSERGLWKTDFYMSYTDAHTMQRVDCVVHDEQHPPSTQLFSKLIEGRYRLFLGNSPRNVTSPRQRKRLAPARGFQPLGNTSNLNATERLRVMLKQKLTSISGPRLPKAMRIFGDNSLSLHILGITFPPLNEDTPLAYLRSKLADFKEQHGDQIVDYLVNLVQQKVKGPVVTQRGHTSSDQSSGEFSRAALFQGAGDANFDLFHFAIYRRVVSEEQVNSISRQWLLPSRPFPAQQETVRIPEDSMVLLNLTMLHGVFDDLRLELRDIPEFGRLLLIPNKTVVTTNNRDLFRELPLEYQRSIIFQPESDQNNENLPLPNPVAFSRRLEPYATVRFGIVDSLAGRVVNKSSEARIDVFVDAVNDAPRLRKAEMEFRVEVGVPVPLNLKGDDVDGAPPASVSKTGATGSSDFLSSFSFSNDSTGTASLQSLKIVRMPQFGKLFDCNTSCGTLVFSGNQDVETRESTRVYRNSTDIVNATHSTSLVYIYRGWGQEHPAQNGSTPIVVDELWYKLSDGDPDIFSDVAVIKFILVSGMEDSVSHNAIAAVRLEEDSLQILNLGTLDPLAAFFNARTRFKVTALPRQGALFQYNGDDNDDGSAASTSLEFVGARITAPNSIVADLWGRVFFVPNPDYFNMESQRRVLDPDYFEYQVVNATPLPNDSFMVYENSRAARFVNQLEPRRVELEVENVPDVLVVLPPFTFTANKSSGDAIPTPTVFEDPDSTNPNDTYQVNLEAEDGASEFELGFAITDDDVMSGCPFERPCTLIRSTNGARVNVSSSSSRDDELQFHITSQLYDPSHVQVTGTKTALSMALSALTFRDLSGISLDISHEAGFTLWVKRINVDNGSDSDILQAQAAFTISFPPDSQSGSISGENLGSVLNSQLERYISTLFFLVAGWLVLSSASCLSIGFCCCCCAKARKMRRQKFEQEQRRFQAQVAQNDHEYTVLLMSLADTLLEPNLLASRCVLECCITSKYKRKQTEILTQAFIWHSLQPLLESERQGTRFVFQLMAIEYSEGIATTRGAASHFQHEGFLTQGSTASRALACFCRSVGSPWISALLMSSDDTGGLYLGDELSQLDSLLDRLATQADALPTELVILCRACAKLFRKDEDDQGCEMELDAVHLVVFNHFLGPALLFPLESVSGFTPSTEQRNTLRALAYRIVGFADQWSTCDPTKADALRSRSSSTDTLLCPFPETQRAAACRYKYEAVLQTVSRSSTLTSAYDPSEPATDVDCELLGMCLMNIHSLLDGNFPEFKRRLLQTRTSTNVEQIEDTITRTRRLVQALSWPPTSIHELVEYARPELLSDPLLWIGLSFQEWQDRAQPQQQQHRSALYRQEGGRERLLSCLADELHHDEDVILEQDGRSPHDVDWLSSWQHS